MHLGESDKEGELIFLNCQLEESPASNDLEAGQDDPPDIHVRDEDIASDLPDMLKKTEIKILVLKNEIVLKYFQRKIFHKLILVKQRKSLLNQKKK